MKINLGDRAEDRISGYKGIVTAIAKYLNGCTRILIEPEKLDDDGKMLKSLWFDDVQVKVTKKGSFTGGKQKVGGPARSDPSRDDPA